VSAAAAHARGDRAYAPGADQVVADIPGGQSVILKIERDAPVRGPLALGRVTLSSTQPLGLWRAWSYVHFPLAGVVYPLPEPGAPPLPRGAHGQDLTAPGQGEESEFAGLREYQPGDPLQRVAWKAARAARAGRGSTVPAAAVGHARGARPRARYRDAPVAPHRMGRLRALRAVRAASRAARFQSRTTATASRGADDARDVPEGARDRRRDSPAHAHALDASPRLTATQIRWLGALLCSRNSAAPAA
jgi:hypothetical protein